MARENELSVRELIETINKLTEEATLGEEVLQDIPETDPEPEVAPAFNDGMSLADTLDTKAKIARCLEALKVAIEEFKEATAEKIDLLKDELVLKGTEALDNAVRDIEVALASGSNILGDSELNDVFKTELPQEDVDAGVDVETEAPVDTDTNTEADVDVEEEDEDEGETYDFENEAALDLFADDDDNADTDAE